MRKSAGEDEVAVKDSNVIIRKSVSDDTGFDIMSLPSELFDEETVVAEIPAPAATNTLGHTEDLTEETALQLIGKNQYKKNCIYKLVSTPYHTCVVQYDTSLDPSDPQHRTEFELEEYREGYRPGIDEGSVSSGFWQGQDAPSRINPMAIVVMIMVVLLFIGIGGIAFLLSLAG